MLLVSPFFFMKIRNKIAFALFSMFSLQSTAAFSLPLIKQQENINSQILISQAEGYREHEYQSTNDDDTHAKNHNWKDHYHSIESIKLKSNGNLKIRFCEKVELLEGQVFAQNIKYDVNDAYRIRPRSIVWKINKKNTFSKGDKITLNTANFLGRPTEKSPNSNEIRSFERGCGIAYAYIPNSVEVKGGGNPGIIGLVLLIGTGVVAGGSSGSGSSSSN